MQQVHGNRSVRECSHTQITGSSTNKDFSRSANIMAYPKKDSISDQWGALTLGTTASLSEGASASPSLFTRHSAILLVVAAARIAAYSHSRE